MVKKTKLFVFILFLTFTLIFSGCGNVSENDGNYGSNYKNNNQYSQRKSIKTTAYNNVQPIKTQSKPNQRIKVQTRVS